MSRKVYEAKGILDKRKKRPFVKEVVKEVQPGEDLFDALFAQKIKVVKQKAIRAKETVQTNKIKRQTRAYDKIVKHDTRRPARSRNLVDSFDALLEGSFYQAPKHESPGVLASESSKSENVKKKGKFFKTNGINNFSKPKLRDSYLKLIEDSHVEFFKQENSGKELKMSEQVKAKHAEIQINFPYIAEKLQNMYVSGNSSFTHKNQSPVVECQRGGDAKPAIINSTPFTQKKSVDRITWQLSPIVPMFTRYYNNCEEKENSSPFTANCHKYSSSFWQSNADLSQIPKRHSVSEHSMKMDESSLDKMCGNERDQKSSSRSASQRTILAAVNEHAFNNSLCDGHRTSVPEDSTKVEASNLDKTCGNEYDEKSCCHITSQSTRTATMNVCYSFDIFASYDNEHKCNNYLCDGHNKSDGLIKSVTSPNISNSLLYKKNYLSGTIEVTGNNNFCSDECGLPRHCGANERTASVRSAVCNNSKKFASSVILKEHEGDDDIHTSNSSVCGEPSSSVINVSAESLEKASDISNLFITKVNNRRGHYTYKNKSTRIKTLSCHTNDKRLTVGSTIVRSPSLRAAPRKSHAVIPLESQWSEDCVSTGFREAYIGSTSALLQSSTNNRLTENKFSGLPKLSFKDMVLQRCGQTEILNFADICSDSFLGSCKKIGEGVYGEVFSYQHPGENSKVLKIMPIEGDCQINGERQKLYEEVLSEIVITMELSNLRKNDNFHTSNFPELICCRCVQGVYPSQLLVLWHEYDEEKTSENDSPEILPEDQIYIILELANVGSAMESYTFSSAKQSLSAFMQVTYTLAVAEFCFEFEHRDLHWGNILIQPTKQKKILYKMYGEDIEVQSYGIQASIIDFTLSRMTYEGCFIFNNLADDPALFEGKGDYQFDIYRCMKDCTENNWHLFEPYNNVLWLSYILRKMISDVYYRNKSSKEHNRAMTKLKELSDKILNFRTVWEVTESFL